MAELSNSDKQYIAKILYTQEKLEGKIIAKKVGVSENTISKWVNQFNWKALRNRLLVGKEELLTNFYEQLEEMNTAIKERDPGKRYANAKEADALVKYTVSIRNLETDLAIADISMSGIKFIKSIQDKLTPDEVIAIADLWNDFLHEQIKTTMRK